MSMLLGNTVFKAETYTHMFTSFISRFIDDIKNLVSLTQGPNHTDTA